MWRLLPLMFLFIPLAPLEQVSLPAEVEPIWAQMLAQPEDFSVACMPLSRPEQAVVYNAQPFPLASVSKLLIFIEYAERVEAAMIPADEKVNVAFLERYNLPRTDRGAHDRFMANYPEETRQLSLWIVAAEGMMQYSSNAASDYLLDRLAPVDWDALYSRLSITNTGYPNSLTMIPLLMNNHVTGRVTQADNLSTSQGEQNLELYVNDEAWREAEIAYRSQGQDQRSRSASNWPDWDVQAEILQQHTVTGTVVDFLAVMRAIYDGDSPLSPSVQDIVQQALRWEGNDYLDSNYIEFGSKLGFYSGGTLTLVAYGHPYDGEPVISATFMRNIPRRDYYDLVREDGIGYFTHWMNFNACAGLVDLFVMPTS